MVAVLWKEERQAERESLVQRVAREGGGPAALQVLKLSSFRSPPAWALGLNLRSSACKAEAPPSPALSPKRAGHTGAFPSNYPPRDILRPEPRPFCRESWTSPTEA